MPGRMYDPDRPKRNPKLHYQFVCKEHDRILDQCKCPPAKDPRLMEMYTVSKVACPGIEKCVTDAEANAAKLALDAAAQ